MTEKARKARTTHPSSGTAGPAKGYTAWPFDAAEAKRRQEETARALGAKVQEDVDLGGGVKLTLVLIPPGEFLMGSAGTSQELARTYARFKAEVKWFNPEHSQHRVRLTRPFWMGKLEVTQEQWEAVMGNNPSKLKGPKNPVESVSWNGAQEFLQRLNARVPGGGYALPTEAQWEYACRAGSSGEFCFGDDPAALHRYGNYADRKTSFPWSDKEAEDGFADSAPAGSFLANAWGLHDLHGNVREWCSDRFDLYANSPIQDPEAPRTGDTRVLRGGSCSFNPAYLRSAFRLSMPPETRLADLGLRVVRLTAGH